MTLAGQNRSILPWQVFWCNWESNQQLWFAQETISHGSSSSLWTKKIQALIREVRKSCASWLGAKHRRIISDRTQTLATSGSFSQEKMLFSDCWRIRYQRDDCSCCQISQPWRVESHQCKICYQATPFNLEGSSSLTPCSCFFDYIPHFEIFHRHYRPPVRSHIIWQVQIALRHLRVKNDHHCVWGTLFMIEGWGPFWVGFWE